MNKIKYPRTLHLPWSEGMTNDDKMLPSTEIFEGKEVVASLKLDGENSSIYSGGYTHARSLDSKFHISREWIRKFANDIGHLIPENLRICGENMYAKHSIAYNELESYFYGFSIWDENNYSLSWNDTIEWFELLGIVAVPVLYRGIYDEKIIKSLYNDTMKDHMEGYVVRLATSFHYNDFSKSVAKFVKKNHVQTDTHWMHQEVIKNALK